MSGETLDKLTRLLKKASDLPSPPVKPARARPALEQNLPGAWEDNRRGAAFVARQTFSAQYQHGVEPITPDTPLQTLAAWARDERLGGLSPSQFAFLDTETSGLSGGTGTYAFLVGVGRFVGDEFALAQFFLPDPAEEPALLQALTDFLAPCRALVTFNGKAFDAPLLRARYRLHEMPCPFDDFSHLDLLPLARRLWRDRLPSRTLKYLEEEVLAAPRSSQEVPGYEIPWLYFDFLRTGAAAPLKGVFYHNAMDVVAMAALLHLTAGWLHDPHRAQIEHGLDVIALARLFEDLRRWEDAAQLYERGLAENLPEADFWQAVSRLSTLERRRKNLTQAVRLWEQAAEAGHVFAHVELAKYEEHQRKDDLRALEHVAAARAALETANLPEYQKKHWLEDLNHRQERLSKKTNL
ncbi:MAG: hypothetical protein CO094_04260 [Anaerolineae bacterium CG_4_9_14_3_um_filter_57_17]|nr:hypothetical protein [bacterium]OIO83189.1 MAG: hypothetical protein AUK01_13495 [Anaerolineae bacterium CG2_30_57_67]PJB67411.1 MAG: hypothetical protein CO094_04260 [Anaerolineae bacterium CG_4_9_14_3_um_filter_57_17]